MKDNNWIYVDEYRRRDNENNIHQLYFEGKWINIKTELIQDDLD